MLEKKIDATGLSCPLPLLKAKRALNSSESGTILQIVCDDPASERDFKVFSKQSGHELISSERSDDRFTYRIRKT